MRDINYLENLKVVIAIFEKGNFTRAAQHLNLSNARVSKVVDDLEDNLNVTLFKRSTRSIKPTIEGEKLYRHAVKLLQNWQDALDDLSNKRDDLSGTITLAAPLSWGLSVLSPILSAFQAQHPEIQVNTVFDDEFVNAGTTEFDVILRLAHQLEDSSLICRNLTQYSYHLVATEDYLQTKVAIRKTSDLADHHLLVYQQLNQVSTEWILTDKGKEHRVRPTPHVTSNNSQHLLNLVLKDLGVAHLPSFLCHELLRSKKVTEVLPDVPKRHLNLYALRRKSAVPPARLIALLDFISKAINQ